MSSILAPTATFNKLNTSSLTTALLKADQLEVGESFVEDMDVDNLNVGSLQSITGAIITLTCTTLVSASTVSASGYQINNQDALLADTNNTLVGVGLLPWTTVVNRNVVVGTGSAPNVVSVSPNFSGNNVLLGFEVLPVATDSLNNVMVGEQVGRYITNICKENVFIGHRCTGTSSVSQLTNITRNVVVGNQSHVSSNTSNAVVIGASSRASVSNNVVVGENSSDNGVVATIVLGAGAVGQANSLVLGSGMAVAGVAGVATGTYLRIVIGGVPYKIALLTDI